MMGRGTAAELVIDRAIWGLDERDEGALATAVRVGSVELDDGWERAAAMATYVLLDDVDAPAPAELVARLTTAARDHIEHTHRSGPHAATIAPPRRSSRIAWSVAAAAALVAGFFVSGFDPQSSDPPGRAEIMARADVMRLDWQRGPSERAGEPSGDVVWSPTLQAGYMRLRGLPANDPAAFQYQLWVFDGSRSAPQPVDGGVFDISDSARETLVPIEAKLRVGDAVTFAVTIEAPGGVVVSDQEHIVVVAKP